MGPPTSLRWRLLEQGCLQLEAADEETVPGEWMVEGMRGSHSDSEEESERQWRARFSRDATEPARKPQRKVRCERETFCGLGGVAAQHEQTVEERERLAVSAD